MALKRISKNISFEEATRSQTATRFKIDNSPGERELANMKLVAEKCFEPIREWYGKPLIISSFFRSKELNMCIGGASQRSQHIEGKAIDIDTGNRKENTKILNWAKKNLQYDQLLSEYPDKNGDPSWVHISFDAGSNRNQFLIIK